MSDVIKETLIKELTTDVSSSVVEFADKIAHAFKEPPLGILFYGSVLRDMDPEGILDFYVITNGPVSLSGHSLGTWANYVLPPNVYYMEHKTEDYTLRAKVAVLSYQQFMERSTIFTLDTTIWARFCQPVRLVWVHNEKSADQILQAIRQSVVTAACWAALLGPEAGSAEDYWHNLFAHTYAAELRVEKKGRSRNLLAGREARYAQLLRAAWEQARLGYEIDGTRLTPCLTPSARRKAARNWQRIATLGRPLNIARLIKAAFTFRDGVSYLLWKIQRHTGQAIHVSSFEQKHPILTLPLFLWRVRHVRSHKGKD